jgi:hypothetical protein
MTSSNATLRACSAGKVPNNAKHMASITLLLPEPIAPTSTFVPLPNSKVLSACVFQLRSLMLSINRISNKYIKNRFF